MPRRTQGGTEADSCRHAQRRNGKRIQILSSETSTLVISTLSTLVTPIPSFLVIRRRTRRGNLSRRHSFNRHSQPFHHTQFLDGVNFPALLIEPKFIRERDLETPLHDLDPVLFDYASLGANLRQCQGPKNPDHRSHLRRWRHYRASAGSG